MPTHLGIMILVLIRCGDNLNCGEHFHDDILLFFKFSVEGSSDEEEEAPANKDSGRASEVGGHLGFSIIF